MANRFWVGDGGNWSDSLNHWSASSGGAPNASKPGSSDDVFFDANSFSSGSQTVVVDEAASCKSMDWTGVTDSPAFTVTNGITIAGSVTLDSSITYSGTGSLTITGTGTITTKGIAITGDLIASGGGITVTLGDDYTSSGTAGLRVFNGGLDTNSKTVSVHTIDAPTGGTKVITLGTSVFTCRSNWDMGGSNVTVNAGTATIILSNVGGTAFFTGGSQTYNRVELGGGSGDRVINGSNTFNQLAITLSGTQTIKFTDGTTQTVANFTRINDTTIKTLTGTSTGGWAIVKTGPGPVSLANTVIDYCTATPDNIWFFPNSVDGGNNRNLRYVIPYAGSGWWAMRR